MWARDFAMSPAGCDSHPYTSQARWRTRPAGYSRRTFAAPTLSKALAPGTHEMGEARVTIGVPVYNGARHLEPCLDSLLAQTYEDIEIVISDNASTDRTPEICRAYQERDERVRYHRQPRNIGAAANYNYLVGHTSGELFSGAATTIFAHLNLWSDASPRSIGRRATCSRSRGRSSWMTPARRCRSTTPTCTGVTT